MKAQTSQPIHEILVSRRSPRSLNENIEMSKNDLIAALEAARWAPSAMNGQPWRFYVGFRGDQVFQEILHSLEVGNQAWAKSASVLMMVTSLTHRPDGTPIKSYMYDCGLAVANMSFEIHSRGYVVHQMAGFDSDKARTELSIPSELTPVIAIAIGKQDKAEKLTGSLYEREVAPRVRKPLEELVLKGLPN